MLTGSGVDEAWTSGVLLAEGVLELMRAGKPFTRENLEPAYVQRRRASWLERESRTAADARDGFHKGFLRGLIGMALAGISCGRLALRGKVPPAYQQIGSVRDYCQRGRLAQALQNVADLGVPVHEAVLSARGWPEIEYDGKLLISHQDALLMGGKVQAAAGYADHVQFIDLHFCRRCRERTCISMCSGQAITQGEPGEPPLFDREKCVHCGACQWNCGRSPDGEHSNVRFSAGAGGLHSAEN